MYRRAGFARYARQPFVSSLRPSAPPLRLSSSGLELPSSLGIVLDRVRGCFDETDRSGVGRRYASTAQDPNYSPASELHNDGRASSGPERPRIRANLFQLRPYQEQCVNAVLSELSSGQFTRLGVSAPTGSGKTAMFTSLIASVPPRRHPVTGQEARQVLVVVNSIQLATQTAEAIQRAYPDMVRDSPRTMSLLKAYLTIQRTSSRADRRSRTGQEQREWNGRRDCRHLPSQSLSTWMVSIARRFLSLTRSDRSLDTRVQLLLAAREVSS